MQIIDCEQRSTAWFQARIGVITASEANAILTPLFAARTGDGVETYLYRKAAEKILGWTAESGGSWATDQGNIVESIAIPWFAFEYDCEPRRVGFCLSDDCRTGCSPDSLLGENDGLEVKSPLPPTHLKYLTKGELPPEYAVQVHFSMFVTSRPQWTFVSFSRQLPPLVLKVKRDEKIQAAIRSAVDAFSVKFDAVYNRVKGQIDAENAAKTAAYEANPNR